MVKATATVVTKKAPAEKPTPKLAAAVAAAASAKKNKPLGPKTLDIIEDAIKHVKKKHGGVSRQAILTYIQEQKSVTVDLAFKKRMNRVLSSAVTKGNLVQVKGSYKIAKKEKVEKQKSVAKVPKPTAPKSTKPKVKKTEKKVVDDKVKKSDKKVRNTIIKKPAAAKKTSAKPKKTPVAATASK